VTTGPQRRPRPRTRNVARRELDPARRVAFEVLRAVDAEDSYANLVLPRLLRRARLGGRDAAFATELAYGALRGRGTYDAVLAACVDRPLAQIDPPVLDALRLGAHQLLGMRVPAHAAVSATVDVVRAEIGQGAAGFANAVLRRVAEHDLVAWLERIVPADADDDTQLALTTSHPVWIVRAFRDALAFAGRDAGELAALLAADNAAPAVTLAALPGLATPAELTDEGRGEPGALSPHAVRLAGPPDALPAVREGRARVQDEGSQLVTLALAAAPVDGRDARWLDLCAGPGGKSALLGAVLAQRLPDAAVPAGRGPDRAVLVANEVSPHRTELVRRSVAGVERAAPGLVDVRIGDGRTLGEDEPAAFDRVLVDAPCTGLGALRRRPEARWRRTPADLATLGPLQRELLRSALHAVRPGGVVAYVTCSPHPAETRLVVDDVLRRRADVERLDARDAVERVGRGSADELGGGPDVQLWPHVHGTDAMYLALLRRLR
jgi:16S rRNA (cytosine967-C5)-methyltransferase